MYSKQILNISLGHCWIDENRSTTKTNRNYWLMISNHVCIYFTSCVWEERLRRLLDTGCKFLLFVNADHKSSSQNSNQNEIFSFTSVYTPTNRVWLLIFNLCTNGRTIVYHNTISTKDPQFLRCLSMK